jgi:hypothetical protein
LRLFVRALVIAGPYLAQCGLVARNPHAKRLAEPPAEKQHAALELLRGTMIKHELIAYRIDRATEAESFDFDSERWLNYVPLRNPDAITVKERLPAGAVAVLLNPMHTHTDIILPIDESEERLLEAIDGSRSFSNIFQLIADDLQDDASQHRAFEYFQQLWRHDQIVLDASRI